MAGNGFMPGVCPAADRSYVNEPLGLLRVKNSEKGCTPRLADRMRDVLPTCGRNRVRIVTNMGAANPAGATRP